MEKVSSYQTLDKSITSLIVDKDSRYLLHNCQADIIVKENINLEIVNFRGCDLDESLNIRLEQGASVKIYNIVITSTDVLLKENVYLINNKLKKLCLNNVVNYIDVFNILL